jgi:hypothetical protein
MFLPSMRVYWVMDDQTYGKGRAIVLIHAVSWTHNTAHTASLILCRLLVNAPREYQQSHRLQKKRKTTQNRQRSRGGEVSLGGQLLHAKVSQAAE